MKDEKLVESLMIIAVRLGTGQQTEMPLMVDVLRLIANELERREAARQSASSEAP